MWCHYCPIEKAWISVGKGEPHDSDSRNYIGKTKVCLIKKYQN
jgi:hypothetical protein